MQSDKRSQALGGAPPLVPFPSRLALVGSSLQPLRTSPGTVALILGRQCWPTCRDVPPLVSSRTRSVLVDSSLLPLRTSPGSVATILDCQRWSVCWGAYPPIPSHTRHGNNGVRCLSISAKVSRISAGEIFSVRVTFAKNV